MSSVNEIEDELQAEYDFTKLSGGGRGMYVDRYRSGTNLVLLDPNFAKSFPNKNAVNEVLGLLMQIAQRQPVNNFVNSVSIAQNKE